MQILEISTGTASDAHSRVTSGAASDERSGESAGEKDRLAAKLAGIRKVMSHPVAIAQSSQFLKKYLPHAELEHVSSTAEGVRLVKTSGDAGIAAIGTVLAARRYGLQVLAEDIQDHKNNFTRFILVGKQPIQIKSTDTYKTSLQVTLPEDYPGALHQVLSAFAWRRINLSRIESRPTQEEAGELLFSDRYLEARWKPCCFLRRSARSKRSAVRFAYWVHIQAYSYEYNTFGGVGNDVATTMDLS